MASRGATSGGRLRPRAEKAPMDEIERLRLQRLLSDWITGLPLHPVADLRNDRIAHLGIVYIQLGRFAGTESVYGWELYDRVLRCVTESLNADLESSPLRSSLLSFHFTGCDGFYALFDQPNAKRRGVQGLEAEAQRLRDGAVRRLRQKLGRTIADLMAIHCSAISLDDDPRTRPSRNLIRGLREAARLVEGSERAERLRLAGGCRTVLAERHLHPVFQPVLDIRSREVVGYEALIRGPVGGELEFPDVLFAVAEESGLALELENLCLETIFAKLPRGVRGKKLFVNASPRLLTHSVFLDERNLEGIRRAHPDVVVEISEKEVVHDYRAFRGTVDQLREAGLKLAIDDAGSGYSGLEAILQIRPEYIKVAMPIVRDLHADAIKRQVISALSSLASQIQAPVIAEGIEQTEELDMLRELGVPFGQGFLLGRPQARIARTTN